MFCTRVSVLLSQRKHYQYKSTCVRINEKKKSHNRKYRNVLTAVVANQHLLRWKQNWNKIKCTSPELAIACTTAVESSLPAGHDLQWKLKSHTSVARNLMTVQYVDVSANFNLPGFFYSAPKSGYLWTYCEYWSTLSTSDKSKSSFVFFVTLLGDHSFLNQHLARQTWKTRFKDWFTGQRLYTFSDAEVSKTI